MVLQGQRVLVLDGPCTQVTGVLLQGPHRVESAAFSQIGVHSSDGALAVLVALVQRSNILTMVRLNFRQVRDGSKVGYGRVCVNQGQTPMARQGRAHVLTHARRQLGFDLLLHFFFAVGLRRLLVRFQERRLVWICFYNERVLLILHQWSELGGGRLYLDDSSAMVHFDVGVLLCHRRARSRGSGGHKRLELLLSWTLGLQPKGRALNVDGAKRPHLAALAVRTPVRSGVFRGAEPTWRSLGNPLEANAGSLNLARW